VIADRAQLFCNEIEVIEPLYALCTLYIHCIFVVFFPSGSFFDILFTSVLSDPGLTQL